MRKAISLAEEENLWMTSLGAQNWAGRYGSPISRDVALVRQKAVLANFCQIVYLVCMYCFV